MNSNDIHVCDWWESPPQNTQIDLLQHLKNQSLRWIAKQINDELDQKVESLEGEDMWCCCGTQPTSDWSRGEARYISDVFNIVEMTVVEKKLSLKATFSLTVNFYGTAYCYGWRDEDGVPEVGVNAYLDYLNCSITASIPLDKMSDGEFSFVQFTYECTDFREEDTEPDYFD